MTSKKNPWFRMYSDFMFDEKVEFLSFEDQRHYVFILCMKNAGLLDKDYAQEGMLDRAVAKRLGLYGEAFDAAKRRLIESGLVGKDFQPIAWEKRQYISDTSTDRVRAYRERKADESSQSEADAPKPRSRQTTLAAYIDVCRAAGTKPIPEGHHIRRYCQDAGITDEMVAIAWLRFREEHTTGARKAKLYIDWPETFANCVKSSWYGLWVCNAEGPANWTSKGLQEKRVADARRAEKEAA